MLSSAITSGVQGIQTNMRQLDQAGSDVARLNIRTPEQPAGPADVNIERSMVTQVEAKHLVKANARTIEVASSNIGTLIDLKV